MHHTTRITTKQTTENQSYHRRLTTFGSNKLRYLTKNDGWVFNVYPYWQLRRRAAKYELSGILLLFLDDDDELGNISPRRCYLPRPSLPLSLARSCATQHASQIRRFDQIEREQPAYLFLSPFIYYKKIFGYVSTSLNIQRTAGGSLNDSTKRWLFVEYSTNEILIFFRASVRFF